MPDDLSIDLVALNRTEVAAVGAFHLRAANNKGLAIFYYLLDTLDQQAISRLAKNDHITSPDFTRRKRGPSHQNIIPIPEIREKTVAADLEQTQYHLENRIDYFFRRGIGRFGPFGFLTLDLPEDLCKFVDRLQQGDGGLTVHRLTGF